ncbi:MAG: hypothetical protein AELANPGJ_00184 [Anaerolineae bacterium]|jgi:hypothetical protein|nr:hypothetical protein [Anaerolineae bacterium]OQY85187.1 MAG: hypothetical protein B6D42_03870 [Anaerolineae bacterium UTCFX5]
MSILAVDFGSVHTRAVLIDQVDGAYELIGFARTRTTDRYPAYDVKIGLDRVIQQLTASTGRRFVNDTGAIITPEQQDRSGVESFVITASGGRPLRAVIVGLREDGSVAAAKQALSNTYVDVVETLSLEDGRDRDERLNAVLHGYPNIVVITGGVERGASESVMELVQSVKLAVAVMDKRRRPQIVYAGNSKLAPYVTAAFEGIAEVAVAANVRPAANKLDVGPLRAQMTEAFNRFAETRSSGFSDLAALSAGGVQPTARGYSAIASYFARLHDARVIVVDIGSAVSIMSHATPRESQFSIRTDLGVGHNALTLLDTVDPDDLLRWLPFAGAEEALYTHAYNKSLRQGIVPFSLRESFVEHAILRTALQEIAASTGVGRAQAVDLVVLGGASINETGRPGYSIMLALDGLEPAGVTRFLADPYGLTAALGAVAGSRPDAASQVADGNGYAGLGTAISIGGRPRFDKPAVEITVETGDGDKSTVTVNGGHLVRIPVPVGVTAVVRARVVGRGLDIDGSRSQRFKVEGGGAGIIIDARGRPLSLDMPDDVKATLMLQWIAEVTGDEPRSVEMLSGGSTTFGERRAESPTEPSRVRQRQSRRDRRRGRRPMPEPEPEPDLGDSDTTIEDLRNALS